jgi:hypothetical protein
MNKLLPIYDKVAAGGTAGLVTTVIVGVLSLVHITLPAAAVAAIVTLVMFGVSYLKTETKIGAEIAKVSDEMLKIIEAEGPVR